MKFNFTDIFEYKAAKVEAEKDKVLTAINAELTKFNFEDDYLTEGGLEIIACHEVIFHTCRLENFTDNRSIIETSRPNSSGVHLGYKKISDFNLWDYDLSYQKKFQNADDSHNIEESHHAIGCSTCKQHGKIRCSSCRGAGDVTCSSCSGRGEKQCNSCSGSGETKCWSCSGRGTKETGYGDSKRIERCSSCSGRGNKPCTSCRSGYITCSSCSGRGRVSCYTCHGSGEVTCYQCDGYRTMDHYFIVKSNFINLQQKLYLTNPFPGFDTSKAEEIGFRIENKLIEFKENRFIDAYFEQIQSHPLFRQICVFFDFHDSEVSKLISSRITLSENIYFEVSFTFYSESYTIYFDQYLSNAYYAGRKPSDQYELDLLNKSLNSAINNELDIARKTIQKLSKYDFININENYIITAIDDTQSIYNALSFIDTRNYSDAERQLKSVSAEKRKEIDHVKLIRRLNKIYLLNTAIVGLFCFIGIFFALIGKDGNFTGKNILISTGIFVLSWIINRFARNIYLSRLIILFLFALQFSVIIYLEKKEGNAIRSEWALKESFNSFKEAHYTVSFGQDSIILIEPTGVVRRNYYLPKGKPYRLDIGGGQKMGEEIAESNIYLDIDQQSFENARGSYMVTVALKDNNGEFRFDIEASYNDIAFDDNDNDIEVSFMRNSIDEYKINNVGTMFISNSSWKAIQRGEKLIEKFEAKEQDYSLKKVDVITQSEAYEVLRYFSTIVESNSAENFRSIFAEKLDYYHSSTNKTVNSIIEDTDNNFFTEWRVVKDEILSVKSAESINQFEYNKMYTIQRLSDQKFFVYDITGIVTIDPSTKKILGIKDIKTEKVSSYFESEQ